MTIRESEPKARNTMGQSFARRTAKVDERWLPPAAVTDESPADRNHSPAKRRSEKNSSRLPVTIMWPSSTCAS